MIPKDYITEWRASAPWVADWQLGLIHHPFAVDSRWFNGTADIPTYQLEELLGTKLRALYQRKKGRDLFDLGLALRTGRVAPERIVEVFNRYMQEEGAHVTRAARSPDEQSSQHRYAQASGLQ